MIEGIRRLAKKIGRQVNIMEVCGGHTNVIMRFGIQGLLPDNINLLSGPGCPVCVTPQHDIDCMIEIAKKTHIATYGDMLRVPGTTSTLEKIKAETGNVHEVYSATEVIELSKQIPDIVFLGIGFETTAPMTAFLLKNNIRVYSSHRLVPPALDVLIKGELKIDGFIDPGHVSAIIGSTPYKKIKIPQVITGFDPESIIKSIKLLLEQIIESRKNVINIYEEIVKPKGNKVAQELISNHFKITDSDWRGLGTIPNSGLEVKDNSLNAKMRFKRIINDTRTISNSGCRCGDVLKGLIKPHECKLFKNTCNPSNPVGACMVSTEGSCNAAFRYRDNGED